MTQAFECRGLVKTYPEFQLGPLDLELEPGTVLGYVGPNGSGKTTTMHCLVGLVRPDAGGILVFGRPNDLDRPAWKLDVGYVGEVHAFYENWPAETNLRVQSRFYPSWSESRAAELATRFQLPLRRTAKELSSGDRVKLALVRALAHSPRLLLLDEPTAGLDPVVRAELLDVLFEAVSGGETAILYSTHILSDISRLADELAFLDRGRLKLRRAKEDLTEQWARISFRLPGDNLVLEAVVHHRHEGFHHVAISSDRGATLRQLGELGAEDVAEHRMSIDEIAVQILRG
jgi:ABC-2 type transport system ATP-binding protein